MPGRSSYLLGVLVLPFVLLLPRPAAALELLSWWRRELIEVEWTPGDWATYAQTSWSVDGVVTDTVTVRIREATSPEVVWLEVETHGRPGMDRVLLRPAALKRDGDPLAAVDSLLHREADDGPWLVENVDDYRDQALVQRQLRDPFVDPEITRSALPDTTIDDRSVARERVQLAEAQREESPVGRSTLVVTTDLRAVAVVSPAVPLAGILRARSVSTRTTTTEGEGSRRSRRGRPPVVTETRVECLAFGRAR